jgi:hypothetical protein
MAIFNWKIDHEPFAFLAFPNIFRQTQVGLLMVEDMSEKTRVSDDDT